MCRALSAACAPRLSSNVKILKHANVDMPSKVRLNSYEFVGTRANVSTCAWQVSSCRDVLQSCVAELCCRVVLHSRVAESCCRVVLQSCVAELCCTVVLQSRVAATCCSVAIGVVSPVRTAGLSLVWHSVRRAAAMPATMAPGGNAAPSPSCPLPAAGCCVNSTPSVSVCNVPAVHPAPVAWHDVFAAARARARCTRVFVTSSACMQLLRRQLALHAGGECCFLLLRGPAFPHASAVSAAPHP
jgi:hypothetical protein